MVKRLLYQKLIDALEPNKVVVIYGPRRVGKTTILREIESNLKAKLKIKYVDGEDFNIQKTLSSKTIYTLQQFLGDTELFILDEAQKIPEVGISLKLIVDHVEKIKVIGSGSASLSLAQKVGEPLTGRKKTLYLYPFSLKELIDNAGRENTESITTNLMIYGGYPETLRLSDEAKVVYLKEIIRAYLFKDILELENIRDAKKLRDLLILLAFKIGKEVSLSELGNQLDLHKDTVFRYLDLLEKSFILINIRGFSRNLRKEVTKNSRYYFYDNGIRNALINNFNPLELRDDVGQLWENFIVIERLKKQGYENISANNYFWRTYDQQEIDWIEEREGRLFGYEIKWNPKNTYSKAPNSWIKTYKNANFKTVTKENYLEFLF